MNPTPAACLGIIANPSSGRDLRRLFSWGSTFSMAEKINAVLRLLSSAGALGIQEAWLMPDTSGLAREVQSRAQQARLRQPSMPGYPQRPIIPNWSRSAASERKTIE